MEHEPDPDPETATSALFVARAHMVRKGQSETPPGSPTLVARNFLEQVLGYTAAPAISSEQANDPSSPNMGSDSLHLTRTLELLRRPDHAFLESVLFNDEETRSQPELKSLQSALRKYTMELEKYTKSDNLLCDFGEQTLAQEWIMLFDKAPGLLDKVPADVRIEYESLTINKALGAPSISTCLAVYSSSPLGQMADQTAVQKEWSEYVRKRFQQSLPGEKSFYRSASGDHNSTAGYNDDHKASTQSKPGLSRYKWPSPRVRIMKELYLHKDSDIPLKAFRSEDHALQSHCTPAQVDITFCSFPLSVEEILTYFPLHTTWRMVSVRLRNHGWSAKKCMEFIYWTRELEDHTLVSLGNLNYHFRLAKQWHDEHAEQLVSASPFSMSKEKGTSRQPYQEFDYYLADLAEGVKKHPQGQGAQALTHAILHALRIHDKQALLSTTAEYVGSNHLFDIPEVYHCEQEDRNALRRLGTQAEDYYKNKFIDKVY